MDSSALLDCCNFCVIKLDIWVFLLFLELVLDWMREGKDIRMCGMII